MPRETAHRLFLRELRDYRDNLDPMLTLVGHTAAPVLLLAESYRESADMALERAVQALACWYEPAALVGVLDRLRSSGRDTASPALEYLEHILPRAVFRPVRRLFESPTVGEATDPSGQDPYSACIEAAWKSDDEWLRACAVRASRCVEGFDRSLFSGANDPHPGVRAELEALAAVA